MFKMHDSEEKNVNPTVTRASGSEMIHFNKLW